MLVSHTQSILLRIGILSVVILSGVGFHFWTVFEQEKSDDAAMLNQLSQIRESLHLYFVDHNQYPPLISGQQSLTVSQTLYCLSDEGFMLLSSRPCEKKDYLLRFKGRYAPYHLLAPFIYQPVNADDTQCISLRGCDGYSIPFELKTNSLFPKGIHHMTPTTVL